VGVVLAVEDLLNLAQEVHRDAQDYGGADEVQRIGRHEQGSMQPIRANPHGGIVVGDGTCSNSHGMQLVVIPAKV
jgi:hypothetical protein